MLLLLNYPCKEEEEEEEEEVQRKRSGPSDSFRSREKERTRQNAKKAKKISLFLIDDKTIQNRARARVLSFEEE